MGGKVFGEVTGSVQGRQVRFSCPPQLFSILPVTTTPYPPPIQNNNNITHPNINNSSNHSVTAKPQDSMQLSQVTSLK